MSEEKRKETVSNLDAGQEEGPRANSCWQRRRGWGRWAAKDRGRRRE